MDSGHPFARMLVTLPADVWGRIVLSAQESEDWQLRTLIEQAVHEAGSMTVTQADHAQTFTTGGGSV